MLDTHIRSTPRPAVNPQVSSTGTAPKAAPASLRTPPTHTFQADRSRDVFETRSGGAAQVAQTVSPQRAAELVGNAYREILKREPDAEGFATWTAVANQQAASGASEADIKASLEQTLRASDEYGVVQTVDKAFQDVLGRTPGEQGYWHNRAKEMRAGGASLEEIKGTLEGEFRRSDEYQLNHLDELVGQVYRDVLGREGDPEGMQTWTGVAEEMKAEGKMPAEIRDTIAAKFRESAEYKDKNADWVNKTPYINQYHPSGEENGYTNGGSNCGPTSAAMIARAVGYRGDLTDAQLINHLGRIGGTTEDGTGVNGIVAMGAEMGMKTETSWGHSQGNVQWMADQLKEGKVVVANGNFYAMDPHANPNKNSGHYVTVVGLDGNGNFLVNDPADRNVHAVSPENMRAFLATHQWGGAAVAFEKP